MKTIASSQARSELFELIKAANNAHAVYHITHKDGNVVLLSEEEYESLVETIELLSIPGFRESIKRSLKDEQEGRVYSLEEAFGKKKA